MSVEIRRSAAHWGAFRAEIVDGVVRRTLPFEHDRHPSALVEAIPAALYAANRIRRPAVRRGYLERRTASRARGSEPFVEVGWDEALALVGDALESVRARHGNEAIFGGSYGWASAGRVNHARTLVHRFLNLFGGSVGQVTNYSWGAAEVLLKRIVGNREAVSGPVTDWQSIVEATGTMLMFGGANPKNARVTSGGGGSHDFVPWLERAARAGVKFIVVSPDREDAPAFLNAEFIPIRPNTDTAMMLALAHVVDQSGRTDTGFLGRYTVGYRQFRAYLRGETDGVAKTPAWAEAITDVPAATIAGVARQIMSQRSMLTATWSLQRADHGEQPYWALVTLAAMLGEIGLPGGGFGFGYGSINGLGNPRLPVSVPAMPEGRNPLRRDIPVSRITDLLLRPGETIAFDGREVTFPEIKLIYWAGGNPFHHHQDLNRLRQAWQRPETIIVQEPWWTPTARQADIVLPATTAYERDDLAASSRDRYILAMQQLVSPLHEARNDYDIFTALAARFGFVEAYTEGRTISQWTRHLYDEARRRAAAQDLELPDFETFWARGHVQTPDAATPFVLFEAFRRDPEANPLATPSGRIEIFSETIAGFGYADCPGHASWIEPVEWLGAPLATRYRLHLVTSQPGTKLHSQQDGVGVSAAAKVDGREVLAMHPADAAQRGLRDGDVVRAFNDRGACLASLSVSEMMMPGVVRMPTGAWYDPEDYADPAALEKAGNPNVLTRDAGTSSLAQGPSPLSVLVEVERAATTPPVSAHAVPPIVARSHP
ncbi:MAG: biotin transporter BioY [Devosia sp. 67-54]|uniref:molybdopterin-dependent oxidoreductase n=1 Tax=unclassified Devosia TaxID=196773 RepID=UPI00095B2CA1|nr:MULTISPECIES: molybdopterin-dependent oxidoreductase [unclassified Devosia]MBN9306729.1 molybdopterin-dependent oxidoreductase [Devosia sp.]OJX15994.1 MAG: biotin transporter BioY [Devosia sp. 67-54]